MNKVNEETVAKFKKNLGSDIVPKGADELLEAMLLSMRMAAEMRGKMFRDEHIDETELDTLNQCDALSDVLIWVLNLGEHMQHLSESERLVDALKQQELTPMQRVRLYTNNDVLKLTT